MKYNDICMHAYIGCVALFARAWIEISYTDSGAQTMEVALFARAWIEIKDLACKSAVLMAVALFARAWIEIPPRKLRPENAPRRPLREGVD